MSEINVKMSAIYQAAHDVLPAKASAFASRAGSVTSAIDPIVAQVALAGNHPVGPQLRDLATEVFVHLRSLVTTFNDSAVALDRIADRFVEQDAEAASWFEQHKKYAGDPERVPVPAAPKS